MMMMMMIHAFINICRFEYTMNLPLHMGTYVMGANHLQFWLQSYVQIQYSLFHFIKVVIGKYVLGMGHGVKGEMMKFENQYWPPHALDHLTFTFERVDVLIFPTKYLKTSKRVL